MTMDMRRTRPIGVWLAWTFLAAVSIGETASEARPNVLFVIVDDMNDWVGCLGGYPGVRTPNIDRLARRGVLFSNAHCASSVCNPSRTATMTGLRPSTTGIYNNGHWWRPHLPDVVVLPAYFKAHGYHVAGGGKTFHHTLGFNPPDSWDEYFHQVADAPWHFDYLVPGEHTSKPGLHWPEGFPLNQIEEVGLGKRPPMNYREFDWGPFDKPDMEMGDGQMVDWAVKFLERQHERPFFLAAGIYRPHLPWYVPRKYFELYPLGEIQLPAVKDDDLDDVPPAGRTMAMARYEDFQLIKRTDKYRQAVQAYLASISFADAMVGRLLDGLDAAGHASNTVIVLWSDHGWHLGEKQHWHKMTLWERATRVPLVIVAPEVTTEDSKCSRPVSLVDLYPTLTELCGLPPKRELDGTSLVRLLREPSARWDRPALITYQRANHAVRSQRWRYIRYADGSEELYDLENDPHEWTNLADRPEHSEMKQTLGGWLPKTDAANAPAKSAYLFDPDKYRWTRKKKR